MCYRCQIFDSEIGVVGWAVVAPDGDLWGAVFVVETSEGHFPVDLLSQSVKSTIQQSKERII